MDGEEMTVEKQKNALLTMISVRELRALLQELEGKAITYKVFFSNAVYLNNHNHSILCKI